jgi:hypothetical protein
MRKSVLALAPFGQSLRNKRVQGLIGAAGLYGVFKRCVLKWRERWVK